MVDHRRHALGAALLALGLGTLSCGSGVGNSSPRVTAVPVQTTGSGSVFALDVAPFVTDPENEALTYSVSSGGGSFAGSTYSNTFATLGTYPVQFMVSDASGLQSSGTLQVIVQTANLAVIQEGDDLLLVDTDTNSSLTVADAAGFTDTLRANLSTGQVVYERQKSTKALFVYDPNTTETTVLGDAAEYNTQYGAQTTSGHVVFTRTSVTNTVDSDLFIWNSESGVISSISEAVDEPDENPMVNSAGLVFFESGLPTDIYYYDPSDDTFTLVADAATAETLRATLPNGAAVFSRIGGGGEQDLYYFRVGTGLVEIGADLSTTIQAQTKTYKGVTSTNLVAFEVTGATDIDLYVWDPSTGTSTAVDPTSVDETFVAVTANNEIIYNVATGASNNDVEIYTHGTGSRDIAVSSDNETYQGALSNGDVVILRESATGDDLYLYDTSGSSLAALAVTGVDDYTFNAVLAGDKVAYTRAGGSGGVFVVNTTGAPSPTLVGAPGSTYQGQTTGGDFVVQTTVSAQFDIVLWDESATAVVTISNTTGNDSFGAGVSGGDILFTRQVTGKSTTDLFIWDPGTTTETRITDGTTNHSVVSTFAADNS